MKLLSYLQQFDNVELAVQQHGKGIPLVWGHALMGSVNVENRAGLWNWEEVEKHAEVVRYDARGHGNSDGSYDPEDYRWSCMAHDMLAVADSVATACGVKKCVLGGLSMGAATALEAAVQQADKVAGLVLVLPPTAWQSRPRQAAIYRRLGWVSGLLGAAPYRLLDMLPIPVKEDGRNQLALHTMKGLARANPLHVQAILRGAALSDMPDLSTLEKLDVPTLILAWEDDTAHPLTTATTLAETLPRVHSLIISHPTDISDWTPALCEFLDKLAAPKKRRAATGKRRPAIAC
jgi:pimeloyl-ACP methyl ester carboxylesterase